MQVEAMMAEAPPMSSEQPQQTDGPKVTFRQSWLWHAAEEGAPPKLDSVPLFKFFGKTTTSNPELDALTKEMSERDKEKSEPDALTSAMEFNTPESQRETGKKRSVAEALRQEALRQTPLNPKKPKEADHGRELMRELFGPDWEHPKEVQVPDGSLDPLIWPRSSLARIR